MIKGIKRATAFALALPLLLLLTGCNVPNKLQTGAFRLQGLAGEVISAARPFAIMDMSLIIATKKTSIDYIAQLITGEDCSTLRASKGGHYCRPWYENKPIVPQLYCYRTLAAVSCYEQPSRYPSDKLVGIRQGGLQETY